MSNKDAWNDGNFDEIDAAFVNEKVTGGIQLLYKTSRALQTSEEHRAVAQIADDCREELLKFKPNLPILLALRNEGMRDRHWKQVRGMDAV